MLLDGTILEAPLTEDLVAFREELRAFFKNKLPPEMAVRGLGGFHTLKEDMQFWAARLNERGWSAAHWPSAFGGPGWTPMQRYIFEEESVMAGAPRHGMQGLTLIGPVIYTFGSIEQKERYLPKICAGEEIWAQGFSEPGAGSDLASLRTRAELKNGKWIINGQKIWTSEFHFADMLYCLVRTESSVKPQRGISLIVFDAKSPGITSRPIVGLDGAHSLNEVFFDDVEVPELNLIGEREKGWTYAKFLLDNERAWAAEVPRIKRAFCWLLSCLEGRALSRDHAAELGEIAAEIVAIEGLTLRALVEQHVDVEHHAGGGHAWPSGNILKVLGSELQQRIGELQLTALGQSAAIFHDPYGSGVDADALCAGAGMVGDGLIRRAASIYGGANELQRDIIARALLTQ